MTDLDLTPGSPAWRVLRAVAERPGELDVGALAARVFPPPRIDLPLADHDTRAQTYAAWRRQEVGDGPFVKKGGRRKADGRQKEAHVQTSKILAQLQKRGLIRPTGGPVLASWWIARVERDGVEKALRKARPQDDQEKAPRLTAHLALVERMRANPPTSVSDLLEGSRGASRRRAYQDLVMWGALIPPSFRWPTDEGSILVLGTALVPQARSGLPTLDPSGGAGEPTRELRVLRTEADAAWALDEVERLQGAEPGTLGAERRDILEILLLHHARRRRQP